MEIFSKRLKEIRKEKNISQKNMAEILMTTNSSVSDWECGRSEPCQDILVKLALYFNVSTDYLLGLEDENGIKINKN